MESIKLWGVVLPRMTNMLGKVAQTLRVDGTDKPLIKRLEWFPDKRRIVVELESKPEMPTEIILPETQVSAIIPLKAESETKAKLPDKTVSSSKSEEYKISTYKERNGGNVPTIKGDAPEFEVKAKFDEEARPGGKEMKKELERVFKPKKRGRPKKKKG